MVELTEEQEKFAIGQTFVIGLAFFTTGVAWSMYNTQVNIMLFYYLGSYALVGAWMAMDNLVGIILQPIMGNVSDNTRTKLGRRIPYLIIGIPAAAFFFVMIATVNVGTDPLWLLLLWMFFFNVCMGFYRSQAVALMPDFVVPVHRSKGNAIINLMGGVGAVIAYLLNLLLVPYSLFFSFVLVSIIMVASLIVLLLTIKEKNSYSYRMILEAEEREGHKIKEKKEEKPGLIESFKDILAEEDKSTLFMLFAIFSWFVGYQALEALFTVYGVDVLGLERGFAGGLLLFVAVPFILMAAPAGILATKIGRRLTIKIGLFMVIGATFTVFLIPSVTIIIICFIIFGCGWALVNINSIVIVWEMAPTAKKIGTYTGVYYFFSFLAAILGPFFVGVFVDLMGNTFLFLVCDFFFIAALIFMFLVRRGEAGMSEEKRVAIQEL
ncbi:MAG: MFS transporter [Candidatus Hermodarchaeota archaeon]